MPEARRETGDRGGAGEPFVDLSDDCAGHGGYRFFPRVEPAARAQRGESRPPPLLRRAAARAGQQGGFFDRLFGGGNIFTSPPGEMGGTYRTVCVRTCDGYYFPISFETTPDHFREDEQTCQRMCPAADVSLYTYHNPGEEVAQSVSLNGRLYTELPTAFQYRKAINPACSCRRPGESWLEALKANGPDDTLAPGDVVVTDRNANRVSQPAAGAKGKQADHTKVKTPEAMVEAPGQPDKTKRKVRAVGPTFLPAH